VNQLCWTDQAVEDLAAIRDYIERDSPYYAQLVVERLFERVDNIPDFPRARRVVPELERKNIREVIAGNYRILYRVRDDLIEGLTIFRSSRLIPPGLEEADS